MHPTRAPNPADGSPAVTEEREQHPAPDGAAAASSPIHCREPAKTRRTRSSGRPGPTGGGESHTSSRGNVTSPSDQPGAYSSGSLAAYRRSSSGYGSIEGNFSVPSSPLLLLPVTADKATQTPSPAAQALTHALHSLVEARPGASGTHHGSHPSPSSMRQRQEAGVMQEGDEIARRLQRIGDDLNERYTMRALPPHEPPPLHQEPVLIVCFCVLLFAIGRYLQGSVNSL